MGGRGGVQGFGRFSGMASGVTRDNGGYRGYAGVLGCFVLRAMVYDCVCYTTTSPFVYAFEQCQPYELQLSA
jgi:hypothetical protein